MENGILTAEEIETGNSLIARFNGYIKKPDSDMWINLENEYDWCSASELRYEDDPLAIMYNLQKISELKINRYTPYFEINNYCCRIELTKLSNELVFRGRYGKDLTTNIWIVIVEFLDWYLSKGILIKEEPSLYQPSKN